MRAKVARAAARRNHSLLKNYCGTDWHHRERHRYRPRRCRIGFVAAAHADVDRG
jgi:hypothetical protein